MATLSLNTGVHRGGYQWPIYNFQCWMDNFERHAPKAKHQLCFWNLAFLEVGAGDDEGVRWAILEEDAVTLCPKLKGLFSIKVSAYALQRPVITLWLPKILLSCNL